MKAYKLKFVAQITWVDSHELTFVLKLKTSRHRSETPQAFGMNQDSATLHVTQQGSGVSTTCPDALYHGPEFLKGMHTLACILW
jgi:hypothetical protein